jgi:hypothetical protein
MYGEAISSRKYALELELRELSRKAAEAEFQNMPILAASYGDSYAIILKKMATLRNEAIAIDDDAEDQGLHPDDRMTCFKCRTWAEDCNGHHFYGSKTQIQALEAIGKANYRANFGSSSKW